MLFNLETCSMAISSVDWKLASLFIFSTKQSIAAIANKSCLKNNQSYLNQTLEFLIEGEGKDGKLRGRSSSNKIVKFLSDKSVKELKGQFTKIKIIKADGLSLAGEEL